MTDNNLLKNFKEYDKGKPQIVKEISGLLGIPINGNLAVEVPNRNGFVYVRLRNNTNELIQAFNEKVSPVYGLPVLVVWRVNRYEIQGRDTSRYQDWGSYSAFLPRHGSQHSLNFDDGQGGDVSFIYSRQFIPYASIPSGTEGSGNVFIMPHVFRDPTDATWNYLGDTSSDNFLPAKPADASGTMARMMLLYWNLNTDAPAILTGTFFDSSLTGTAAILPYVPLLTSQKHVPLSAIRLVSGTETILWDNIYDMRQFATSSTLPSFEGGFGVQDEGIPQGTGTIFNFVGAGVVASISGSVVNVNISSAGGGGGVDQIGIYALEEGSAIGTGTQMNFVGAGVTASRTGTMIFVDIPGGGDGGGGGGTDIVGQHLGNYVTTGSVLNVRGGFLASGTTMELNAQKQIIFLQGGALDTGFQWLNQPAADRRAASQFADLTGFSQARLMADCIQQPASTGTFFHMRYAVGSPITGSIAPFEMAVDPDNNGRLYFSSGTRKTTPWFDIDPPARNDFVWVTLMGTGGNGNADPQFYFVGAEFR